MPVFALLLWLAIGAAAGFLARRFLSAPAPFGLIGDIVLGILGAIVGGYLLGLLGATGGGGIFVSLVTAFIGAVLLIWAASFVTKKQA